MSRGGRTDPHPGVVGVPPGDALLGPLRRLSPQSLAERYYNASEGTVDFTGLAELLAGSLLILVGTGWSSIVSAVAGGFAMLLGGVSGFIGLVTRTISDGLGGLATAVANAASGLAALGPFGGVAALAIALVALYIVTEAQYG